MKGLHEWWNVDFEIETKRDITVELELGVAMFVVAR